MKDRHCKNCTKLIDSLYGGRPRVYCDRKCLDEYHVKYLKNRYREKHPPKTNICVTCYRSFIGNRKYCSNLCYPNSRISKSIWYKIKRFEKLKKELNDIGYKTQ